MASSYDPRERDDRLGWVTRAVFGDERIRLWVGHSAPDPAPAGWRVVSRYAVAPSVARARFLLPVASRRVVAASVLAYNALRPLKVRLARAAVGTLARAGGLRIGRLPVLSVAVPEEMRDHEVLLTSGLAAELGFDRLHAAIGVPTPDPNFKPTLQLFDDAGVPRGYAKIGWNEATRSLVRAECTALRELPEANGESRFPVVPRLRLGGVWAGQDVALIEPLPKGVRRLPASAPPRLAELLAVARRGAGPAPVRPLAGSPFLDRITRMAQDAARDPGVEGGRVVGIVRALSGTHGATSTEFGAWHGDWVPWNLALHGSDRLFAWDWEHSGGDVPVGFDLAHHGFQCALILDKVDAIRAAAAAEAGLARYGDQLGLTAEQLRLVLDAYLMEMWLRTWRLAAAGAGWNAALHPALLTVLERRLGMPVPAPYPGPS